MITKKWMQKGNCIYEFIVVATACIRIVDAQTIQNSSMEREGGSKVSP